MYSTHFQEVLFYLFLDISFISRPFYFHLGSEEDNGEESLMCLGCSKECEQCVCSEILVAFTQVNSQLHSLVVLARVAEEPFLTVIHKEVCFYMNAYV